MNKHLVQRCYWVMLSFFLLACQPTEPFDYTLKVDAFFQVPLASNSNTGVRWSWENYRTDSNLDTLPMVYQPDEPVLIR